MNFILYGNIWILACLFVGVIFAVNTLIKKGPLYLRMICWAVICAFFARLFHVVFLLLYSQYDVNINMGTMGIIGSLLFLLSANYGQIDALVDDGGKKHLKTRFIALIAPLLIVGMCAYFMHFWWTWPDFWMLTINTMILAVVIIPCIYYNFKHAIIYDVKGGIVHSLRLYNILAVVYELMIMMEWVSFRTAEFEVFVASLVIQGIVFLLLLPAVRRGVKKWTI